MTDHTAQIADTAKQVVYTGAGLSIFGGFSASEVAAIGGLIVGVFGLIVQIYYKRKEDRRQAAIALKAHGVVDED